MDVTCKRNCHGIVDGEKCRTCHREHNGQKNKATKRREFLDDIFLAVAQA